MNKDFSQRYLDGQYSAITGGTWHSEDSPWKAAQILKLLKRNGLFPSEIAELGCGAGGILQSLSADPSLSQSQFYGYDISPGAIEMANRTPAARCHFFCEDLFQIAEATQRSFDLLLVIDVIEHVPEYLGFTQKCGSLAKHKIFHIPLDLHVSSVIRNAFIGGRYTIGHLHYFTAESALATLRDSNHKIIDYLYTDGCFGVFHQHPSWKRRIAYFPRFFLSKLSIPLTARWLGGFSLLVLTE